MKKIKISNHKLHKVLDKVMIPPSIVKHLRGGHIYAYASWWDMDITQTVIFKRRKVLRLIRKFNKKEKEESQWKRNVTFSERYKYIE